MAVDGIESFEYSQFYPTSYHVVAGRSSHFFYGFTDSECRRRGSMTKKQKERRASLEEERFDQRCLPGTAVADDGHVPDLAWLGDGHEVRV